MTFPPCGSKAKQNPETIESCLRRQFRAALTRPERLYPHAFAAWWAGLLATATLPIILAVALAGWLFPGDASQAVSAQEALKSRAEATLPLWEKVNDERVETEELTLALMAQALSLLREAPPPTPPESDSDAADIAAKSGGGGGGAQPSLPPPGLEILTKRLADFDALRDAAVKKSGLLAQHKLFGARGYFAVATTLLSVFLVALLASQYRLARRYWAALFHDYLPPERSPDPPFRAAVATLLVVVIGGLLLIATLGKPKVVPMPVAGLVVVALGVTLYWLILRLGASPHPEPADLRNAPQIVLWLSILATAPLAWSLAAMLDFPGALGQQILEAPTLGFRLLATAAGTLFFSTLIMTGFIALSYAYEFPSATKLTAIGRDVVDPPHHAARVAGELWALLATAAAAKIVPEAQNDLPPDPPAPLVYNCDAVAKTYRPLPAMSSMTAASCDAAIRHIALPLAFAMVATLITISLGLDVLEAEAVGPDALQTARAASAQVWVLLLGAGFTIVLFFFFVAPLAHVQIYKDQPDAA